MSKFIWALLLLAAAVVGYKALDNYSTTGHFVLSATNTATTTNTASADKEPVTTVGTTSNNAVAVSNAAIALSTTNAQSVRTSTVASSDGTVSVTVYNLGPKSDLMTWRVKFAHLILATFIAGAVTAVLVILLCIGGLAKAAKR